MVPLIVGSSRMHLDFVLADAATTELCLVIELDDKSAERPEVRQCDAFKDTALASAGIPLLRVTGAARQGGDTDEDRRRVRRMKSQDRRGMIAVSAKPSGVAIADSGCRPARMTAGDSSLHQPPRTPGAGNDRQSHSRIRVTNPCALQSFQLGAVARTRRAAPRAGTALGGETAVPS